MMKLYGFPVSNYYNKVKLALLEKGVEFEECKMLPLGSPELLAKSPLGKIPYLETEDGVLVESQVLMNYIEARFPQVPLLPAHPFAAAKIHELITFLELHLELPARELYAEAYFGGKVSDETKERVRQKLKKHVPGFAALAKFSPYIAGDIFTMADCVAIVHLPVVSGATLKLFGEDMLAGLPVADYLARMAQRPTVQKINADRQAALPAFAAAFGLK
jgi:glutathione S-transferase